MNVKDLHHNAIYKHKIGNDPDVNGREAGKCVMFKNTKKGGATEKPCRRVDSEGNVHRITKD